MEIDLEVLQILTNFENKHPLESNDMHMIDRLKLCMLYTIQSFDGIDKLILMFEALEKWSNLESFPGNTGAGSLGLDMSTESRYPKSLLIKHCSESKEAAVMLLATTHYQYSLIEFKRGLISTGMNSLSNAFRYSEKVIQLLPDQIEKFKQLCDAELQINPTNVDACIVLANINFFRGCPQDSIILLNNSQMKEKGLVSTGNNKDNTNSNTSSNSSSIGNNSKRNNTITSDFIDMTRIRGVAKVFSKQYHDAIQDYTLILRIGELSNYVIYNLYFSRAHCKAKIGDIQGAIDDYLLYIAACRGNENNLCDAYYAVAYYCTIVEKNELISRRRQMYELVS